MIINQGVYEKKYFSRDVCSDDLKIICSFPKNEDELFFKYPKATFPLTYEQLQSAVDSRSDSTVILSDYNEVIGFANFFEVKQNDYCSIGNVIIKTEFRGKGAGSCLIKSMELRAIEKYQVKEIHISCFNNNVSALLLYHKLGYIPYDIEERINKKSETIALIKMKKCLKQIR